MPIIFLAVILKIPVLYGMWLIYWAVKDEPQVEDLPGEADDHSFRRWRRDPSKPRGPRRGGPHGGTAQAQPDCPLGRPQAHARRRAAARARHGRPRAARAHPGRQLGAGHDNQTGGTHMGQPVVHFEVVGKDFDKLRASTRRSPAGAMTRHRRPAKREFPRTRWCPVRATPTPTEPASRGGIGVGPEGYEGHVTFYIEVPDVGASLDQVEKLGGTKVMGPDAPMRRT